MEEVSVFEEVYQRLYAAFGPQNWWPGESPFEVMVGAVLTQNTSWANVERAIENLRGQRLLSPEALAAEPLETLAECIRPAGYYRLKARRLKNLVSLIQSRYHGSLEALFAEDTNSLRAQLLAVNGIGPETADSILLYAAQKPRFVVDNYTARILKRHGWVEMDADYAAIQECLESSLEPDVQRFNEYHALLVQLGKRYCRKEPQCDGCPLQSLLPATGPLQPE